MQAWIIDASEMDAEDILSFRSNLLHPNPEIRSFLKPDNKGTTIVIAPKGFGKTLLLKAKRLSIQDKYARILPSGALVEKPSGLPSVIPTSDYGDLRDSEGYWRSVWLLSFTIAVLKATDHVPGRCSRSLRIRVKLKKRRAAMRGERDSMRSRKRRATATSTSPVAMQGS